MHRQWLSLNDCFAWRMVEYHGGILITRHSVFRAAAREGRSSKYHGTLWAAELINKHKTCTEKTAAEGAGFCWIAIPTVFCTANLASGS